MDKQFLDLKTRIENMSTEKFVQWMNEVFLNRNDTGITAKFTR